MPLVTQARSAGGLVPRLLSLGSKWLPRLLGYAAVLVFWSLASGRLLDARLLPSPLGILQEMGEILQSGQLWTHLSATLVKLAIGYAIAYVLGCVTGLLQAIPWWDGFFKYWVVVTMNTPGLIFVLLAAMLFGFSPVGPILAVIVTALPFVAVNVAEGVKALPRELSDMARAFEVAERNRLRHVVIPFLAPYLFVGLRYGFSIAWKTATLAELFGSSRGVGFMMRMEYRQFNMTGLLAWIFFFFALALFLERVVLQQGEKQFFRWRDAAAE